MTNYTTYMSSFVPIGRVEDANLLLEALGFGPNNFSVGMSPSGEEPFTHYALHTADDGSMAAALSSGVQPPDGTTWQDWGLNNGRVTSVIALTAKAVRAAASDNYTGVFDTDASNNGIQRES